MWNYIEFPTYLLVFISGILELLNIWVDLNIGENNVILRIIDSIALMFIWIKVASFSRGRSDTAFIMRMIVQVMYDMRYFFVFMFWIVIGFGFMS